MGQPLPLPSAFILTHGRAEHVITYKTLRRQGFTGSIFLITDDEDDQLPRYQELYGPQVITFSKQDIASRYDQADNFSDRRTIFFARNAAFEIARDLGIRYFFQFDDDYRYFGYVFDGQLSYVDAYKPCLNLDKVFTAMLEFYLTSGASTIAMAQTGDFIGGIRSGMASSISLKRKAMNTFLCDSTRPFPFVARVNEDVATYTSLGNRGLLFLTVPNAEIAQERTQAQSGGMTEMYQSEGTYLKSSYPVLFCPSFVKIAEMGQVFYRIHHRINWSTGVPCILAPTHKRQAQPWTNQ